MTATSIHASDIAQQITTLVRDEPAVDALYYQQCGRFPEFWVITKPISLAVQRRVQGIHLAVYEMYPNALFEFHVLNPRLSQDFDPSVYVPDDAVILFMR